MLHYHLLFALSLQSIVQPEHVVVDVILTRARAHEVEELAEVQRVVPPDLYGTRDEYHDGVAARRRLDVRRLHRVLHLPDLLELLDYVSRALELVPLERHHGLIILIFPVANIAWCVKRDVRGARCNFRGTGSLVPGDHRQSRVDPGWSLGTTPARNPSNRPFPNLHINQPDYPRQSRKFGRSD